MATTPTPDYGLIARLCGAIYFVHTFSRHSGSPWVVPDPQGAPGSYATFDSFESLDAAQVVWTALLQEQLEMLRTPGVGPGGPGTADMLEGLIASARAHRVNVELNLARNVELNLEVEP